MVNRWVPGDGDTSAAILDVAERLVQTRGFNAVSYADVSAEVGVTKAALHYHFATKAVLGTALVRRYIDRFSTALVEIDRERDDAPSKVVAYADLYAEVLRNHRMCLCGMLAAEYETLPSEMQDAIVEFFDVNEAWLEAVLEAGQRDGSVSDQVSATELARSVLSGLEGAMLVARVRNDPSRLELAVEQILTALTRAP
jgi:TetR/AcrR family transcriptional regulator, transcriptional repressor for nem operon